MSPLLGQTAFKINFSDANTAAPSGWLKDYGLPYGNRGNGLTYGWVDPTTRQPVDISARGRNRNPNPDVDIFRETMMHMRFSDVTAGTQNGDWEIALSNGTYRVTVQVGDADAENVQDTRHLIFAENTQIVDFAPPKGTYGVRNGSATVQLTDGILSLNATGGKNTKIHFVIIEAQGSLQTPVVLTSDPLDGLQNVFLNQTISAKSILLPNNSSSLDPATINNQTVKLVEITGSAEVSASVTLNNGTINLQPTTNLKPSTNYRFVINGVKDFAGVDILFFSANFTTGTEVYTPPTANTFKVNFSDVATTPPSGWLKDFGEAYGDRGNGITYGWVDPISRNPVSLVGRGRNRTPSPDKDVFRETFMHMRYGDVSPGAQDGDWELAVPNGSYRVTIQVGDSDPENWAGTRHIVLAEGVNMIDFTPVAGSVGVRNATKVITVNDGKLSVNASAVDRNTKLHFVIVEPVTGLQTPAVINSIPLDGATKVSLSSTISANFLLIPNPGSNGNSGTDNLTITNQTVKLFKITATGEEQLTGVVNGTGGGDAINFTPSAQLTPFTTYRFVIDGVKDLAGVKFLPFSAVFTTGDLDDTQAGNLDEVSFFNAGAVATGAQYTTLTMGPDQKLYGLTLDGEIHRWVIASDGTLTNKETLTAWKTNYPPRTAVGLAFDPKSTAQNLIAYITHCSSGLNNAPDWDDKLSKVFGVNLENEQLLITNLPRSTRDHIANSIGFRPGEDNILYFIQGSNSAGGAPDNAWGNRPERLLSGAVLKLDLTKLSGSLPLDAMTSMDMSVINNASTSSPTMSDGTYNPYYVNAPLKLYATGIRNAYDLVWHSNGQLYVPANGTAGGSLSPGSINGVRRPDGTIYDYSNPLYPPVPPVGPNETQRDFLFRVDPALGIGFFGHPNPLRGEFVMNRAKTDVAAYPSNIKPDANYRGIAFDFDYNKSPNGVIEYKSSAHNNNLRGAMLVVRYSFGDDVIALIPDAPNKDIQTFKTGIPGLTGFNNPLDLTEDVRNGNLYIAEFGDVADPASGKITLLKPIQGVASESAVKASPAKIFTDDEVDDVAGKNYTITVTNVGAQIINGLQATLNGANADQFFLNLSGFSTTLNPGQSTTFQVNFKASAVGPQRANILVSDQGGQNVNQITLNGLGEAAGKEPSLQWIVDTFVGSELINVGDDDPSTDNMNSFNPTAPLLGDEIPASLFRKVDSNQPVTFQIIATYTPNYVSPITELGWYETNNSAALKPVLSLDNSHDRTVDVRITGNDHFDPEEKVFGLYTRWPVFGNRLIYTQDQLNTFDPNTKHHTRVYAVPGQPNTFIVAYEEYVGAYDFQDIVFIVRNVKPVVGGVITLENMIKIPGTNIGFPDDDYYAFSRVGAPSAGMKFHDENTIRIHNKGLAPFTINSISISNLSLFTLPNNDVLPITIGANQFYDLKVKYIDNSGLKGVKNATLTINSTAENLASYEVTLSGGFTTAPEGIRELNPQEVVELFGFKTNTLAATIMGLPNSAYPIPSEVDAGLHGDIVVSEYFKQANPAEPVIHFRFADYGGISPYYSKLIDANYAPIGPFNFVQDNAWYNSILARTGNAASTPIAGAYAPTVNGNFRIQVADYTTAGSNGINASTGFPRDLGVRVYPVKDRNGKVKPYHYIVMQDFIEGGCIGTNGEASCDWNDIMDYIINIKPIADPAAVPVVSLSVDPGSAFNYTMAQHFNPGYSGNKFTYQIALAGGNGLPVWFNYNPVTGEISGNAPNTPNVTVEFQVTGTDLNGINVVSILRLKIGVVETVGACFVEANGEVVIEAENYTRKTDALGLSWTTLISGEASGGLAMKVDNLNETNTMNATTGPQLEYDINFSTPGVYNVWVKTAAQNAVVTNNSAHLGLNGTCFTCANGTGVGVNTATFDWTNDIDGGGTQNLTIQISKAGKYTFTIWMREDGVRVDKIILTQQTYTPSGFGPNESGRGDCNTVSNPPPAGDCFTEANGEVSIEAENFSRKSDALGYSWITLASNDASGGLAMKVDNFNETNTLLATTGPQLEYDINFSTPGIYNVWVRTAAQDGTVTNNSAHLGLNGTCFTCVGGTGVGVNTSTFGWTNDIDGGGTQDITIQINTPGKYTFNIWMREDGVRVDKIILTQQTYTPSGLGVTESAKGNCGSDASPLLVLSHWKMDNDAQDAIGTNHGITQNGATFTTTAKVGTHALNLDGINDFVQVPNSTSLNVNANFSFSLWINPSVNSGRRGIITKLTDTGYKQFALSMDNGNIKLDYEKDANDFAATGTAIPLNQWSLVILTVDVSGKINVYVNGTSVINVTAPTLTNLSTQPLEFGRWGGIYNDSYFGGLMDDIKFYNRALTAAEVTSLGAAGRPGVKVASVENPSTATQGAFEINLYPNPVNRNGQLFIQLNAPQGESVSMDVYNTQGIAVAEKISLHMDRESKSLAMKVSNLKPGLYFLVTKYADKTLYKRFIVTQE